MAASYALHSATLRGVEALPVTVEVHLSGGLPGMTVVGMPDNAVLEARARVRCALKSCGYDMPREHVTVNLAPSDIRKVGTCLDLPIAVGILAATSQLPRVGLDGCLFVGELGLDGGVCAPRGSMAYALLARDCRLALVAHREAAVICAGLGDGVCGLALSSLSQLKLGVDRLEPAREIADEPDEADGDGLDYADVQDQEMAKRALVISAAGGHGMLMVGPPGSGKTMLARRMPSILPALEEDARLESMLIHSVCSLPTTELERGRPPFRAPHHSVSRAGLVGGGSPVRPGEVSLAHRGVLFLDELPEFSSGVLQSLRQPMEDGAVRIVRAEGSFSFPCEFQLLAAANPCPCGHAGDPGRTCRCSPAEVARYQGKIGGALLDRIDVFVTVGRPSSKSVIRGSGGLSTRDMSSMVMEGREFSSWRAQKMAGDDVGKGKMSSLGLSDPAAGLLEGMANRLGLGGRAITRTARVARTIADLARHEEVCEADVAEACAFRSRLAGGGDDHDA